MHPTTLLNRIAVAALLTAAMTASNAALTTYTSRTTFVDASSAAATDTFDDLAVETLLGSPLARSAGTYSYTASAISDFSGAGTAGDVAVSTYNSGEAIVISAFTGGVRGVGALIFATTTFGDFLAGRNFTVTATDSLGATAISSITNGTATSFLGFLSTGFITSMSIQIGDSESFGTIDNLVLAQAPTPPVPEPASVGMLLAGLGALAFVRRRRGA